jgi:hypothetical protein
MKNNMKFSLFWAVLFIILYSVFVAKVHVVVADYSDIIIGTTFFFTLFIGYFITQQNDRYSEIADQLTTNDGYFSYFYRITSFVPRVQTEVRDIVQSHYKKIVESGDLAYHVTHPSNTITKLTATLGSVTEEELASPVAEAAWPFLFEVISDVQLTRKKILNLYGEKLVIFQWSIVYILALLLVVSFNLVPSDTIFVSILKICFGTAVLFSVILLHKLDNLTLFGDTVGMDSVHDVLRIVEEKDAAQLTS